MSNRGWLVSNPGSRRSACVSESASYIPLFWLSFLSPGDVENAEHVGQYRLDRKKAIERSADRLPFFCSVFPQIRAFRTVADSLIQKVGSQKSKAIGIELTDLLDEEPDPDVPGLRTALDLIEGRDADYSVTIPARTVVNPFTGMKARLPARRIGTTQDLLLQVCLVEPGFLTSRSKEYVRETIVGHVCE